MSCFDDGIAELHQRGLSGAGIRIGLLDTGVHPTGLEHALTAFGKVSLDGFELLTSSPSDSGQHGTAMATQILSVAPAARLLAAEVIEAGDIAARILTGLEWLAQARVQVICMPLGIPHPAPALTRFVTKLMQDGIPVVAAAGNGGAGMVLSPAACSDAISVGALDDCGTIAAYSGSEEIDGQILPRFAIPSQGNQGTSSAAARMTGLIALLLGIKGMVPARMLAALNATACRLPQQSHRVGSGAIDPLVTYQALMSNAPGKETATNSQPRAPVITRRLADRLHFAQSDQQIHAILGFETEADVAHALTGLPLVRVRRYGLAPIVLVVGTVAAISSMISAPGLLSAESADVDRSLYAFGGIVRFRPTRMSSMDQ